MRLSWQPAFPLLLVGCLLGGCGEPGVDGASQGATMSETLVMVDDEFEPQTWTIPGPGLYSLENRGQGLHNFTVAGAGIDVDVGPGETQEVEIDLDPGEYKTVCKYHVAQGMGGILVVEDGG
jgi:plastocyanin